MEGVEGGGMERWVLRLKEKGLLVVGRGLEAGCVKALSGVPGKICLAAKSDMFFRRQ